ncbi:N-acetylmuramidase family protein [Mangrovicoccus sp. HB161399]|uniref:N-acetylmuramidase family protein n=1 Tax=Mangrovicoccus sp. HB161399 TaxID=2720392 RepID=UPI001554B0B4|nr:N-acetylmuramidase family protein [Mangrovicoccus sp. HB161399]
MAQDTDTDRLTRKERLTLWLDFGKWIGGTFLIGIATIAVNWIIKTRELELARVQQQGELQLAELEQQRVFLESFVSQAMEQDVRVRLRLSHYIKTTTLNEEIRNTWESYYQDAFSECLRYYSRSQGEAPDVEAECRFGGTDRIAPPPKVTYTPLPDWMEEMRAGPPAPVTLPELHRTADALGVPPATMHALIAVEGRPPGFISGTNLPALLFEGHIFSRQTGHKFDSEHPEISTAAWTAKNYVGGQGEYDRLVRAIALDRDAALMSAGWGMFQIMGFNYEAAGHADILSFVSSQFTTAGQLDAMVAYLESVALADALREERWEDFALGYNGRAYKTNRYDEKLAAAAASFDPSAYPGE